jgi:predicted amidohydrolase YtcJ
MASRRLGWWQYTVTLIALFFTGPAHSTSGERPEPASLILKNANVYTANDQQPHAEAVAVRNDRIVYVGGNADVAQFEGVNTKVLDLQGATVLPGFTDSHCHLSGIGQREMTLNLEGVASLRQFLSRVKERVDEAKPGEWVTGRGWIETFWKPAVFPTRQDLDKVSPKNPVLLTRADGHGSVANSAALKIARVTKQTPNPFGGEIMKDKRTGEPTGMLLDSAQGLVRRHLPPPTAADAEKAILLGVERSQKLGWCQLQIAGSPWSEVELLKRLYGEDKIELRIYDAVYGPGPDADRLIREGPVIGAAGNRFTLRTIKVVLDGALGSKGAALLEKYNDHDTSGFLTQKPEDVKPMLAAALKAGIQVETHAIGDRANRTILDWYAEAFESVPQNTRSVKSPRWRVEHAQIVHPDDIPRFAKLGVVPSMQPSHAIGDLHFAPSRLGVKRLEGAYAWQSFLKNGSIIAGGSDAPVERGEPMIEFYAAVARKDMKGYSGPGWHPEQAVSREDALRMFTLWPAVAAFEEKLKGTIEPGKLADFTVLSADIMKVPAPEILKTRCLMTIVGGDVVYDGRRRAQADSKVKLTIRGTAH